MRVPGIGSVTTWLTGASSTTTTPPPSIAPIAPMDDRKVAARTEGSRTRGPTPVAATATRPPQPQPGAHFASIVAAFALPAKLTAATFAAVAGLMASKPELAVPELSRQISDFAANVGNIVSATTGPVDTTRPDEIARLFQPLIALNAPARRFASSIDLTRPTDSGYDQETMQTALAAWVRATDGLHAHMLATQGPDSPFTFFASTLRGSAHASCDYAQERLGLCTTVSPEKSGILRRMDAAGPWP